MLSIKDYIESGEQKDMISDVLRQIVPDIETEEYEELTEMVINKLHSINEYKAGVLIDSNSVLKNAANELDVETSKFLDTFVYFSLIVENVWLIKQLSEVIGGIKDE